MNRQIFLFLKKITPDPRTDCGYWPRKTCRKQSGPDQPEYWLSEAGTEGYFLANPDPTMAL